MRREWIYIGILGILFLILTAIAQHNPQNDKEDWRQTLSKYDKIPFGTHVLFELLPDIFPSVEVSHLPVYDQVRRGDSLCNYILICNSLYIDAIDTKYMIDFVERGNNVFIAAQHFSPPVQDSLGFKCLQRDLYMGLDDTTLLNFVNPAIRRRPSYEFHKGSVTAYLDSFGSNATVLGDNSEKNYNFIQIPKGEGNFFISSVPLAFTNYNILTRNNAEYAHSVLSYLPEYPVIWDEYENVGQLDSDSQLRFMLKQRAWLWAILTGLVFLLIYILFQMKRQQRIIPVIEPVRNTSVQFVETIGRLYFQQRDHADLARKKILYFKDHLRRKYYLRTIHMEDQVFMQRVADKTGLNPDYLSKLFHFIEWVGKSQSVTEVTLEELSNKIEDFHLKTKT